MYRMNEYEFVQFEVAEKMYKEVYLKYENALQLAYQDIGPTITRVDSDRGVIYTESVNTSDYAIHIVMIRENYESVLDYWGIRSRKYKEAIQQLNSKEQESLFAKNGRTLELIRVRSKLRRILEKIVNKTPELQRTPYRELEKVEEYDRKIEGMSICELMEGYWDIDGQPVKELSC